MGIVILSLFAVEPPHITPAGLKIVQGMFYGMLNPKMDLIFSFADNSVLCLMLETVCIAIAGTAMGTSKFSVIRHCIYPEVKNEFFASAVYRFDVNLREASILGLVGAGGVGTQLLFSMNGYM